MTQSGVSEWGGTACLKFAGHLWSLIYYQGMGVLWRASGPLDTSSFRGWGLFGSTSVNAWESMTLSAPAGKEPFIALLCCGFEQAKQEKKCL